MVEIENLVQWWKDEIIRMNKDVELMKCKKIRILDNQTDITDIWINKLNHRVSELNQIIEIYVPTFNRITNCKEI